MQGHNAKNTRIESESISSVSLRCVKHQHMADATQHKTCIIILWTSLYDCMKMLLLMIFSFSDFWFSLFPIWLRMLTVFSAQQERNGGQPEGSCLLHFLHPNWKWYCHGYCYLYNFKMLMHAGWRVPWNSLPLPPMNNFPHSYNLIMTSYSEFE